MTIIKAKDLVLRHARLSDAKALFNIEIDEENIKNMMRYTDNIEEVKKSLGRNIKEYKKSKPKEELIIIEMPQGVAGYISIHRSNKPYVEHKAHISYALHSDFRGKGLAAKAVELVTKYAIKKYNLERIEARCRTFNEASARVLEKAGYTLEGIHKKDLKKMENT